MRNASGVLLLITCLTACSTKTPYPDDWSVPVSAQEWCERPSGAFADTPVKRTDTEDPLLLKQVFFAELLNGFEISHLTLESLTDGAVRVKPWVGSTMLKEEVLLTPVGKSCNKVRWVVDSGWDMDGYMMATGLVWTGGLLIPAAAKVYFALDLNADRELIVHATIRVAGAFAFVFPFRTSVEDEWYAYPAYVEAGDVVEAADDSNE